MPRYRVMAEAEVTTSETWMVDADSPEDAEAKFWEGDAEFLEEATVPDTETDRRVVSVEPEDEEVAA